MWMALRECWPCGVSFQRLWALHLLRVAANPRMLSTKVEPSTCFIPTSFYRTKHEDKMVPSIKDAFSPDDG
jgi:hypothetical protein